MREAKGMSPRDGRWSSRRGTLEATVLCVSLVATAFSRGGQAGAGPQAAAERVAVRGGGIARGRGRGDWVSPCRPLRLRGGASEGVDGEDEGVQIYRTVDGFDLEREPTHSLRTPDQDFGVDYGAHGFMFNIENTCAQPLWVTGLQIAAGDGTPHNYVLYTSSQAWQEAQHDPAAWRECGGGRRLYIPDHEHGVYGKLPMDTVEIASGAQQAFFIHSDDDAASVGYRLLNDISDEEPLDFTDSDEHIRISAGRHSLNKYAFPPEGLEPVDEIPRAFLGIVEYEIPPAAR